MYQDRRGVHTQTILMGRPCSVPSMLRERKNTSLKSFMMSQKCFCSSADTEEMSLLAPTVGWAVEVVVFSEVDILLMVVLMKCLFSRRFVNRCIVFNAIQN